jgi:exodeoxyribonuclease VII small subunit
MPEEKFNFTKAYQEIEEINEWFQGEEIDLDEALRKYERGMELINKCKERLKEAENKFEEIKKKYSVTE